MGAIADDSGGDGATTERSGRRKSANELFPLVYQQLRSLARRRMSEEKAGHTLQATALVHEAYLRLAAGEDARWSDKTQFYFAAAEAMRRILIDHARARGQLKRGGGRQRVAMDVAELGLNKLFSKILDLDQAISRLEQMSPTVAAVVRLRFYAGLSVAETAEALGLSLSTVKREWTYARAHLARELGDMD